MATFKPVSSRSNDSEMASSESSGPIGTDIDLRILRRGFHFVIEPNSLAEREERRKNIAFMLPTAHA